MDWTGVMSKYGWSSDVVGTEPFHPLSLQSQQARAVGGSVARVSTTVGTSSDYGNLKVSFTVSIDCIQSEQAINLAGEAVFLKAIELVNDGARMIGAPELGMPT